MSFMRTLKVSTDPLGKLVSRKQPIGFNDGTLAMHPFGLDGIEPGTLRREQQGQDPHAFALPFDLLVMLPYPGSHFEACMPRGIVRDHPPGRFALCLQLRTPAV